MKVASLTDRFLGMLVDYMLWTILMYTVYSLNNILNNVYIIYLVIFIIFILKDVSGQSPGKKLFKTKIVTDNNNFTKPKIFFLLIRPLFIFISLFDSPFIFFTKKNKRLIDIISKTIVVKTK